MKEICKVNNIKNNYWIEHNWRHFNFNECNKIPKVNKAIEYLKKSDKKYTSENIVDNIIESAALNKKECPSSIIL